MELFNIQQLVEQQHGSIPTLIQVMDVLRRTWIRPIAEGGKMYVLQTESQRKKVAGLLANLARDVQSDVPPYCRIAPEVADAMLDRFYLRSYVRAGHFTVAGGFLLRMMERPETDPCDIALEHDIDVFFTDHRAVRVWFSTLSQYHVGIEPLADRRNTFRICPPTQRSFLIQFSWTFRRPALDLLETFDLPMCQIALDASGCVVTLGFCVMRQHASDAIVHVHTEGDPTYLARRLRKYEARGYRFAVVPGLTYYGCSEFDYGNPNGIAVPKPAEEYIDDKLGELYFKNVKPKHYRMPMIYRWPRDDVPFALEEHDDLHTWQTRHNPNSHFFPNA